MGQIIGSAAKPKRCNLNKLSQLGTPAAGEHILVSSDNSMNAAGQGNFDCYIEGDGQKAATALPLHHINEVVDMIPITTIADVDSPTYTEGAMKTNGTIDTAATSYGYTAPIELPDKATIYLNDGNPLYHGGSIAVLYQCDSTGTFTRSLIAQNYVTKAEKYTNTSGGTIYVGICGYKNQLPYYIEKPDDLVGQNDIKDMLKYSAQSLTDAQKAQVLSNLGISVIDDISMDSEALVRNNGIVEKLAKKTSSVNNAAGQVGAMRITSESVAFSSSDTGYFTSDPIHLQKGDVITMRHGTNQSIYVPTWCSAITQVVSENTYAILVQGMGGSNVYTYTATEEMDVVLCKESVVAYDLVSVKKAAAEEDVEAVESRTSALEAMATDTTIATHTEAAKSGGIYWNTNTNTLPAGVQIEIEVTAFAGNTPARFFWGTAYIVINGAGKYRINGGQPAEKLRLEKGAVEGNVCNFVVRKIASPIPYNQIGQNYIIAKDFNIGELFQGYYNPNSEDAENNIYADRSWVSYPLQKSYGYTIHVNCDFTTYYIELHYFSQDFKRINTINITAESDIYLDNCYGWNIGFRRVDRAIITPASVADAVQITATGIVFKKPLVQEEVEAVVDEKINSGDIAAIEDVRTIAEEGYGMNPFVAKPYYYHFAANDFVRDGQGRKGIASESLEDVHFAARLGFAFVEGNIHKTSDNHFVVIHGTSGTFGQECKSANESVITTTDLRATSISSVTLAWIKANVRYDSYYTKYQTTIPSLEEFCACCKANNIGFFAGTSDTDAIALVRQYLGNNVILYGAPSNIRSTYKGWVYTFTNTASQTKADILSLARSYGAPYMCGLGPNLIAALETAGTLEDVIATMHDEGFLIGFAGVYQTEEKSRELFRLGMDFSGTGHDVNPFESNNQIFDLDDANHLPTTTGTISDGVITLASGQGVTCGSTDVVAAGKAYLAIKFNGTLNIDFGSMSTVEDRQGVTSDGSDFVVITDFFFQRRGDLRITATANTTITHLVYKTQTC